MGGLEFRQGVDLRQGRSLCLGPAWKERGSTSKGGPLEYGVPEFGGRALSEGVWVWLRPITLEGGLRV